MNDRHAWEKVNLVLDIVVGSSVIELDNFLRLGRGAVIELTRKVEDPVELRVEGVLVGSGEIELGQDNLQIRVTSMDVQET